LFDSNAHQRGEQRICLDGILGRSNKNCLALISDKVGALANCADRASKLLIQFHPSIPHPTAVR
jgi:hypothetical protein